MTSEELANRIAALLDAAKAEDVRIYDVRGTSSITDFNVVATGLSTPHRRAPVNEVRATLKAEGVPGYRASGDHESGWVVLDYIDVIAHLFIREAREYYDLDSLWGGAATHPSAT
jgi:ribosome-associated protein